MRPTITIVFGDKCCVEFGLDMVDGPCEGQLEIAGRELIAIAAKMRLVRISNQLDAVDELKGS